MPQTKKIRKLKGAAFANSAKPPVANGARKFRELVILIARRSEGDPRFGAIKMNKLLFYADFLAYAKLGNSITGQQYFALPNGPAPRYKVPVWKQMVKAKEIAVRNSCPGDIETTLALREPDVSLFTPQEIDLVHNLIHFCWGRNGNYLSEMSHKFAGWALAKEKETIPYSVALVGSRKPTPAEIVRGRALESSAAACLPHYAASPA